MRKGGEECKVRFLFPVVSRCRGWLTWLVALYDSRAQDQGQCGMVMYSSLPTSQIALRIRYNYVHEVSKSEEKKKTTNHCLI